MPGNLFVMVADAANLIEGTQGLVPEHPINTIHRLDHRLILIGSVYFAAV